MRQKRQEGRPVKLYTALTIDAASTVEDLLSKGIAGFTVEKILTALVAVVVCLLLMKALLALLDRTAGRLHIDPLLRRPIRSVCKAVLVVVTVAVVLECLQIPATSLVALLSVAGLALSLALQGFLANVAGGLQLIASKPFKLGDYIEAGGCAGKVVEINLVYTKLDSIDNKLIQLPNSSIVAGNIINYTSEELRQVELRVTASYDAPVETVMATLNRLVGENPLTLATPGPTIHVRAYQDSAIEYLVRAWCANKDYWTVYYDLMDGLKPAFDRAGIEMTYPHLNVHMK